MFLPGSREWQFSSMGNQSNPSQYNSSGWRLSDKLRIIKPLEGSLTLHHWQKLAKPNLGNILEEQTGIAIKGSQTQCNINELESEFGMSDCVEDGDPDYYLKSAGVWIKPDSTRTNMTYTDCRVMHPDNHNHARTKVTPSYDDIQLSSGFYDDMSCSVSRMPSRPSSRISSRRGSVSDSGFYRKSGALTFSSNIGLARVLNERHIRGQLSGSTLSLNTVSSLTPSVISTPCGARSFSPTGTPLNSPTKTPGTPPELDSHAKGGGGFVLNLFYSVKAALYGEQQKEAQTKRLKRKKSVRKMKNLGILDKVEEVGVENIVGSSPDPSVSSRESSISRTSSSDEASPAPDIFRRIPNPNHRFMSDQYGSLVYDPSQYLGDVADNAPRSLNRWSGNYHQRDPYTSPMYQNQHISGPRSFGGVPNPNSDYYESATNVSRTNPYIFVDEKVQGLVGSNSGEKWPVHLSGAMGVPGQPGTGAISTRPELGAIPVTSGMGGLNTKSPMVGQQHEGFIGSIAAMFFGRKGGLL